MAHLKETALALTRRMEESLTRAKARKQQMTAAERER